MSAGGPTRAEIPPDTRPSALLLSGLRRGVAQVFLPVALAGQALAWIAYAITGVYRPWSWLKIGFAYELASVRVPFLVTQPDPSPPAVAQMTVALGALTVAVVVLAFRAGRDQGYGLERRPLAAAVAGGVVGLGFAVPSLAIALPTRLAFPAVDVVLLRPEIWAAFAAPLVVGGGAGAIGGVATAHAHLEAAPWGARAVAAARGGFTALWWGLGLAFVGFLALAAVESGATRAYGRTVGDLGAGGAVAVVHHALLLPNQSAMILAASMGAPVELFVGESGISIALGGIETIGDAPLFDLLAVPDDGVDLPSWYLAFVLIPLAGTIAGGRRAGEGARSPRERALAGALAGIVYGLGVTAAAWAATIEVPVLTGFFGGATRLGPNLGRTVVAGLVWGIAGCAIGAVLSPSRPR